MWHVRETLCFRSLDELEKLENAVREFFRSIIFVLESKRLDLSFEKLEAPPCPTVPDEPKTHEDTATKGYR